MQQPFSYVWEFEVPSATVAEFQRHYGSGGSWVALFRRSPAYIETLLLRDRARPERYLTIDRWQSIEAYRAFREQFAEQYAALDRACEGLSRCETDLGSFDELAGQSGG